MRWISRRAQLDPALDEGLASPRHPPPVLSALHVAQAFQPAGSRDFPVPCSRFLELGTRKFSRTRRQDMSALHVAQAFQPASSGDFPVASSCANPPAFKNTIKLRHLSPDATRHCSGMSWVMAETHPHPPMGRSHPPGVITLELRVGKFFCIERRPPPGRLRHSRWIPCMRESASTTSLLPLPEILRPWEREKVAAGRMRSSGRIQPLRERIRVRVRRQEY